MLCIKKIIFFHNIVNICAYILNDVLQYQIYKKKGYRLKYLVPKEEIFKPLGASR